MLIRPYADADREKVIDLLRELNLVEDQIAHDRATTREDARACLDHDIASCGAGEGGALLVAERAGEVVGFLALSIEAGVPFIREDLRRHGMVLDVVVKSAHRGSGAGRQLLAAAEAITRAAGCKAMLIGVIAGNDRARQVYDAAGFRPYALEMLKLLPPIEEEGANDPHAS